MEVIKELIKKKDGLHFFIMINYGEYEVMMIFVGKRKSELNV